MPRGAGALRWSLVVVAALLAACGTSGEDPDGGDPGTDAEVDLDAALEALVDRDDGPIGVVVTVEDGSGQVVHAAGTRADDSDEPPTARDHVRVASLSKAMTGATALTLVEDGVLSLDDTVGKWRPDLPGAWHPITLRELMQHRSGVPDFGATEEFGDAVGASLTEAPAPTEILAIAGEGTDFAPSERYEYSNSNPFVTALVIEAATGEDFAEVLDQRVLEPLGMADTHLPAPDEPTLPSPTMRGYDVSGGDAEDVTEQVSFGGWAWASGGVVSTPADLATFVRAYVGGELWSDELREEHHRMAGPGDSSPPGPGTNSAGPALFRYETDCGTVYGHTGSILGYTQFIAASEDGTRSVTSTISTQVGDDLLGDLRAAQELAVCEALDG